METSGQQPETTTQRGGNQRVEMGGLQTQASTSRVPGSSAKEVNANIALVG